MLTSNNNKTTSFIILSRIVYVLSCSAESVISSLSMAVDARDSVLDLAESVVQYVLLYYGSCQDNEMLDDLFDLVEQVLQYLNMLNDSSLSELFLAVKNLAAAIVTDRENRYMVKQGRPEIDIPEDQLHYLINQGFTVYDISVMFDCSRRTVERRMKKYGLGVRNYTPLSDSELDNTVSEIVSMFPHCGEKSISSRLRSRGIMIKRDRIRESLRRVNPSGVILRCRAVLHRRTYQVPSPNALWHIDGYHKLIRWRFVIHGGIDGYSRLIMFLRVSSNNKAHTVLTAFLQAVNEFGLPCRVRMDRGAENIEVAQFMIEHPERGPGRGSAITGRSVHNQRIERLWRDLFSGCVSFFYLLFSSFEDHGLLNINCPLDLYALHFVFLPIIQEHLDLFCQGWAHHHMRTEANRSPQQLWILGLQNVSNDDMAIRGLNVRLNINKSS